MLDIGKPVDDPVKLFYLNCTHGGLVAEAAPLRQVLARDQEKWTPVFNPITRRDLTDDQFYHFGITHPEAIVIQGSALEG